MVSSKSPEQTRQKILAAAWKLLESDGGQRTRIADIAREAGVSRQAVYLHFPNRAELLIATTQYIDDVEDVAGRLLAVQQAEGGVPRLSAFVRAWGNYIPVIHAVASTLLLLKDTDSDAASAWADRMQMLKGICGSIVEELDKEKKLTKELTTNEATDLMWSLVSVHFWELLTIDRGVGQKRYLELLEKMLRDVLLKKTEN